MSNQTDSAGSGHKGKVRARIFGADYIISGDAEPAYIQEIASFVDLKIRELYSTAPNLPPTKLAVLACVNIADEYFQLKKSQNIPIDKSTEERTKKLITMLEEGIIGEDFIDR